MSEERKLKKRELMIVSRILEEVNFKHYAEYLLTKIKLDEIITNKDENSRKARNDKVLKIFGDIFAFMIQNMHKAEKSIDELIRLYCGIEQKEVENMDIDVYVLNLKKIFMSAVPSVIKDFVDLSDLKKKMKSLEK